MKKPKIFIACDTNKINELKKILIQTKTKKLDIYYKLGLEFFYSKGGRKFVSIIKKNKIFLDLKLNDIPATCVAALNSLKDLKNINYITVHANAGEETVRAVVESAKKINSKLKILLVTILTSISNSSIKKIGHTKSIKELVEKHVNNTANYVRFNAHKPLEEMLKNNFIKSLFNLWSEKIVNKDFSFETVLKELDKEFDSLKVFLVNSKTTKDEKLDYSKYDDGLNAITIGGYSLSRGFTVEGLTVSYFLRNSKMYDTLLQMGRWFGYRNGYEDICKIYMKNEAINWYKHITESTEELREEFKTMHDHELKPRQYGLKVKHNEE